MPEVFRQFVATTHLLESHYKDMQDIEFTVERGRLWMLQTRNGNGYEDIPTKQRLMETSPKFTVNGLVGSYRSGEIHFYAGTYRNETSA